MPRFALVLFPMFAIFALVGRTAVGEQRDRRVFAAAARPVHRALRGLVLGRLSARPPSDRRPTLVTAAAPRRPPVRQVRHRRRVGFVVNLIVFTVLQQSCPTHARNPWSTPISRSRFWPAASRTTSSTALDVPARAPSGRKKALQFLSVSVIALVRRADRLRAGCSRFSATATRRWFVATVRRHLRELLRQQILDVSHTLNLSDARVVGRVSAAIAARSA